MALRIESGARAARRGRGGFSLIEVIVVVAIMAVVAGIAVPLVDVVQQRERSSATTKEMDGMGVALETHFQAVGAFPVSIAALVTDGYLSTGIGAQAALQDGWGNPYVYTIVGVEAVVLSLGPDGTTTAPNLELRVSSTRFLRAETLDELATLHVALRGYEANRRDDKLKSLPTTWYAASGNNNVLYLLVKEGYLTNSSRFERDAWGVMYRYAGSPADVAWSFTLDGATPP